MSAAGAVDAWKISRRFAQGMVDPNIPIGSPTRLRIAAILGDNLLTLALPVVAAIVLSTSRLGWRLLVGWSIVCILLAVAAEMADDANIMLWGIAEWCLTVQNLIGQLRRLAYPIVVLCIPASFFASAPVRGFGVVWDDAGSPHPLEVADPDASWVALAGQRLVRFGFVLGWLIVLSEIIGIMTYGAAVVQWNGYEIRLMSFLQRGSYAAYLLLGLGCTHMLARRRTGRWLVLAWCGLEILLISSHFLVEVTLYIRSLPMRANFRRPAPIDFLSGGLHDALVGMALPVIGLYFFGWLDGHRSSARP